ncbi:transglutaminase domain-containing protein [[Eubacterium] cellulosolvens]
MRGKLVFIAICIVIILLVWQYLPALSIYDQPIVPGFESSKHKKFEDASPGDVVLGYDSDGDGLLDVEEDVNNNGIQDFNLGETDRFDPDSDDDGLLDGEEYRWWTQRYKDQKDINKIPDWLRNVHRNLNDEQLLEQYKPTGDLDGDGLPNILDYDSDNDGWSDGYEVNDQGTDPANPDSDFDRIPDSIDKNPINKKDSDGDNIPDDWEIEHDMDPNDPTDSENDPDNDGKSNLEEYENNTDPGHPDGKPGTFDYDNVDIDQFFESDYNDELFRIVPVGNPKYWRLTAYDQYNGRNWSKSDSTMSLYEATVSTEVTTFTNSVSNVYNLVYRGSYFGYMPTALHTTNMYDLIVDRNLQPYLDANYVPKVYYDKEIGYYINEYMYEYKFATLDYEYSNAQLDNATFASGSEFNPYLTISNKIKQNEKASIESVARLITANASNDFDKVLKIINFLTTNYHYNVNYEREADDEHDAVYWFMFLNDKKEGICAHFASAFVILCRMNNIPARFVSGFALGEVVSKSSDGSTGEEPIQFRVIREGHRHTWAEVAFDGLGWLSFEVTGFARNKNDTTGVNYQGIDDTMFTGTGETGATGPGVSGEGPGGIWDPTKDYDNDTLITALEDLNGNSRIDAGETDPFNPDSDGDGLLDGHEVNIYHTDPLDPDSDNDKLNDGVEVNSRYTHSVIDWNNDGSIDFWTNPNDADTDDGGTWDGIENETGFNPLDPEDDIVPDSDGDGLSDSEEAIWKTNKTDPDTDGDGLLDGEEVKKYTTNPLSNDTDSDGIEDMEEVTEGKDGYKTDPNNPDTDNDGLTDKEEIENKQFDLDPTDKDVDDDLLPDGVELDDSDGFTTNPNDPDTDDDGLMDGDEDINKNGKVDSTNPDDWNNGSGPGETDPLNRDTDGGGLIDSTEFWILLNPLDPSDDKTTGDFDGDGLTDTQEVSLGTNVTNWDSDGDKLSDGLEVNKFHTDPLNKDTDNDNITDGQEVLIGSDPTKADTDEDYLNDWEEVNKYNTDPTKRDTDEDLLSDWEEVTYKYKNSTVDWDGDGKNDFYTDPNNPDTDGGGAKDGLEAPKGVPLFDPLNGFDDYLLEDDDNDNLINNEEIKYGTNASDPDTDDDGVLDGEEVYEGSDGYITDPLHPDTDRDNITDGEEVEAGNDGYVTNPTLKDTDGDGLTDWEEINIHKTTPTTKDSDSDGLTDYVEVDASDGYTTNPNRWDTDNDDLPDGWIDSNKNKIKDLGEYEDRDLDGEIDSLNPLDWKNGTGIGETDPNKNDTDGGGAKDWLEINRNYNPLDSIDDYTLIDTDGDRIPDVEEDINQNGKLDPGETDPKKKDTDGDGLDDFEEIYPGNDGYITNATNIDTDNDTISDHEETIKGSDGYKTNPTSNDTDGDTLLDGDEINKYKTDPTNPDTDGDGLTDDKEVTQSRRGGVARGSKSRATRAAKTDPKNWDTDGDGLPDGWKDGWGYNTTTHMWGLWTDLKNNKTDCGVKIGDIILAEYEDKDLDGKIKGDTNGDRIWDTNEDWEETNNLQADTDGGGAWDGDEEIYSKPRDPLDPMDDLDVKDTDRDGITDSEENQSFLKSDPRYHTQWNMNDTDSDGLWDGFNVDLNYNGELNRRGERVGHNKFEPTFPNSSDSDNDGLSDGKEVNPHKTNPNSNDTDGDGLLDGYDRQNELGELSGHNGYQPTDPLKTDSDEDGLWDGRNYTDPESGLTYLGEIDYFTDPNSQDTDGDILTDSEEIKFHNTNPLNNDTDGGSVQDGTEVLKLGTDPLDPLDDVPTDSDEDGLKDYYEIRTQYNFSTVDWDGIAGYDYYTNWLNNDTDGDGILDGQEVLVFNTMPLHNDSDFDGILDGEEIISGEDGYITNPLSADTDNDRLSDIMEIKTYLTNPTMNDTDRGGVHDYDEIVNETNPLDPTDDGLPSLPTKGTIIIIHTFPKNVSKQELFTVKGNVTDEDGNPLYNISVNIHINSKGPDGNIGSGLTKTGGEFEITCFISNIATAIEVGENLLLARSLEYQTSTLIFKESWSDNNTAQQNTTIYVHSPTILRFIDPITQVPENYFMIVKGKLTDISNLPLANQTVSLLFNNARVDTNNTNETGFINIPFLISEPIGSYDLVLIFNGDDYLQEARANYTLYVQSKQIDIEIEVNGRKDIVNVSVHDHIWVNGSITGMGNEPITSRINITFNLLGTSDEYVVPYQSDENGEFHAHVLIPAREFRGGNYYVYVFFPGTRTYSDHTSNIVPMFVKGKTNIKLSEVIVYRGSDEVSVSCNLTDHQGNGLAGRYVNVSYNLPSLPGGRYHATLHTGIGGKFTFPFKAALTDPLGRVVVNLTYLGSYYYAGISVERDIFIKSPTWIILEDFPPKMIRNQGYIIKGTVLDDQNQGVPNENAHIYLGSDEHYWQIYSTTTGHNGNFTLSILVPTSFPLGVHPLELNFGLSDKYEGAKYSENTEVFAEPLITIRANGTISKGEFFTISISLTEDNGKIPITKSIINIYIDDVPKTQLITDEQGRANYKTKFPKNTGSIHVRATYNGSVYEFYVAGEGEATFKPEKSPDSIGDLSGFNWMWYLLIIIIAIILALAIWRWWSQRRSSFIKRMVTDIISRLETSDKSRRIIYEAYLKLMGLLRRFRIIRKESETPREFAATVTTALPGINDRHLDSLTTLFEEARYSEHRIGKLKRSRAVRNLKHIRRSLETTEST